MDTASEEEFREFVLARRHRLLKTAFLLTGDHGLAEDLVQVVLVRTHRHWHRIERTDAPEVYARRILVNLSNSWWRRRIRRGDHPTDRLPDGPVRDAHSAYELHDELWRALAALPQRMRATIVLRYYEDLSEAEIADALGCSTGTVKSQASRGLQRLRAALSADPDPDQNDSAASLAGPQRRLS